MTNIDDSLFALSVEEQTLLQDLHVFFETSDSVTFCGSVTSRYFRARAVDGSVIEYEPCDKSDATDTIVIPGISITTLCALIHSSYKNTLEQQLGPQDFSSRLKQRLERLLFTTTTALE